MVRSRMQWVFRSLLVMSSGFVVGCGGGTAPGGGGGVSLSVIAGQPGGAGTLDDVGAAARLDFTAGVADDGQGILYFSDSTRNTIRKLEIATGRVTTIAGAPGVYAGVDGVGAAARFQEPWGVTFDSGNLYVAEVGGAIRKVALATGEVTSLAGSAQGGDNVDGIGSAAHFYYPQGIVSDGQGDLYVVDNLNRNIRKIVIATAEVTTFAGAPDGTNPGRRDGTGTAAGFTSPEEIAMGPDGQLYVTDLNVIRQIDRKRCTNRT